VKDPLLARDIRKLAKEPEFAARAAELNMLADALPLPNDAGGWSVPEEADAWSHVDLFSAFPPEATIEPTTPSPGWQRVSRFVYYIQAVLVFLPIAITWLGLKQATTAYGQTLAQGDTEAARRPFLELWQLGFDGRLADLWKFDNVAMMTLGSIGVLITVTLLERYAHRRAESRAEARTRVLRSRLLSVLTRASAALGNVKLSSPARFQAELSRSVGDLNRLVDTIHRLQSQVVAALQKTLEASRETAEALVGGATDVRASLEDMERQLTAMTASTASLTQAVERTKYAIDAVGEKTDEAVGRVGESLGRVLVNTTADLQAAFGEVTTTTGDAVRDTARHLDARVAELAGITAEIRSAVDILGDAVQHIGIRIDDGLKTTSSALVSAVEQSGGEVRAALGDWADTAGAHATRIEMVSDTAGRTVRILEETREILDRLPQELSKTLQDVPVAVRRGIGDDLARLGGAVEQLNTTINELHIVLRSQASASRPEARVTDDAAITNGAA
jgi:methyl-accepting chemotaxis protein